MECAFTSLRCGHGAPAGDGSGGAQSGRSAPPLRHGAPAGDGSGGAQSGGSAAGTAHRLEMAAAARSPAAPL
ncbi:MAG TPA: hypothetical protein VNL77_00650, partial [Roseiflexaceae bacterium]|nr:hypothetical protein [Roseiflexaceae bacterium]